MKKDDVQNAWAQVTKLLQKKEQIGVINPIMPDAPAPTEKQEAQPAKTKPRKGKVKTQ